MAGIEKQLEKVRKQVALLVVAMEAASPKQEVEAKRVINSNKARVKKEKKKEAQGKKIKEMERQAELEKAVEETSKLLDVLAKTNRTLGWKVKATARTEDQNDKCL